MLCLNYIDTNIFMDFHGVKIAIIVDNQVLVYLRDDKPGPFNANKWDFFGGGRKGSETPAECAIREIEEELELALNENDFIWSKVYPAQKDPNQKAFFFVAQIAKERIRDIVLHEGQKWILMDFETFFAHRDVIAAIKDRFKDFIDEHSLQ